MRMQRSRTRYEPTTVYRLAEQARADGVDLKSAPGPWRAARLWQRGTEVPVVTNEGTVVMVDTMAHAADVAGFLNWCGVIDLNPVPALLPAADETRPGVEAA